jgi:hypothetical protein
MVWFTDRFFHRFGRVKEIVHQGVDVVVAET